MTGQRISTSHGSEESNRGWAGRSIGRLRRAVTPVCDGKVKGLPQARSTYQGGHAILGGSDGDERFCFPLRSLCGSLQVIEGFPVVLGVRIHPEDPALLQQAPKSDQWIRRRVDRAEVVVEAREVLSTLSVVAEDLDSFVLPKVFLSVQGNIIDDGVGDRRAVVALIQQREDLRAHAGTLVA